MDPEGTATVTPTSPYHGSPSEHQHSRKMWPLASRHDTDPISHRLTAPQTGSGPPHLVPGCQHSSPATQRTSLTQSHRPASLGTSGASLLPHGSSFEKTQRKARTSRPAWLVQAGDTLQNWDLASPVTRRSQ